MISAWAWPYISRYKPSGCARDCRSPAQSIDDQGTELSSLTSQRLPLRSTLPKACRERNELGSRRPINVAFYRDLLSSSPSMAAPPSDNTYLQCGKPGNRENSWRSKDSCIRTMVGHKQNIPSFCCFHSKHHYREEDLGSTSQIELYISIETSPVLY